jgi:hypothetical protein
VAPFVVSGTAHAQPADKTTSSCERTYSAGEYRQRAQRAYRLPRMWPSVHYRLLHMRQCARHREALEAMHKTTLRQRKLRLHRQAAARARELRLCGTPACNRRLGERMAVRRYGTAGWNCLAPIIDQESGWNHTINYGGATGGWNEKGAYGIPQALPGDKMSSAGADWEYNPRTQIRWLFGYVDGRYGGPCGALGHKNATGWY